MKNIIINNKTFSIAENYNIIQVCNLNNIDIPKFCYHEKLSIAGNCRMCLVEVKGSIKPVASCSIMIASNMEIYTNTKLVKKAREGILEFILLNHPLDCPICDQGGECDLQDQLLIYGSDKGRFYDYKRSVNDKNCGPLIKTLMTRCIHCTRCVRYMNEIAGITNLGIINRGKNMEISNFLDKIIYSEISGNVIDLCPVGALTAKPYSFVARPWELITLKTIDINDSMHCNIRVDIRDSNILRILPIFNDHLDESFISDSTRFLYDGLKIQRLMFPFLNINNKFISKSWLNILYLLKLKIYNKKINYVFGNFLDSETLILLKKLSTKYGNFTFNSEFNLINNDFRNNYILNNKLYSLLKNYNNIFLIGLNLRIENPLLNVKIRYLVNKKLIKIFNIGTSFNFNMSSYNFFNNFKDFKLFCEGKSLINNYLLKFSQKNLLIFNNNFLNNIIKNNFNIFDFKIFLTKYLDLDICILNNNMTNILKNELNLSNFINNFNDLSYKKNNTNEVIYFLNNDSSKISLNSSTNFLIYQGHNFIDNLFMKKFNVLLPSVNYFEKNSLYVNFFGLLQETKFILYPPKNARTDWKIILFFYKLLNININNLNLANVRNFFIDYNFNNLLSFDYIIKKKNNFKYKIINNINILLSNNFYKLNQILKVSKIMTICSREIRRKKSNFN